MAENSLGQRKTKQRDTIYDVIRAAPGPLSVAEIFKKSEKVLGNLGIATVYRTISLLLDARQIQSVILPSGETRYERADLGHHDHFQCEKCERIFDLSICPLHLPTGTILPGGFLVNDHAMTLYGLCPECVTKSLKSSTSKKPSGKKSAITAKKQSRAGVAKSRKKSGLQGNTKNCA